MSKLRYPLMLCLLLSQLSYAQEPPTLRPGKTEGDLQEALPEMQPEPLVGHFRGQLLLGERALDYAVDLDADGSFRRREVLTTDAKGSKLTLDAVGRAALSPDGHRLILTASDRTQHLIEVMAPERWRPLELEGPTRVAEGEIHRDDSAPAITVQAQVRGELIAEGNRLQLHDCGSGLTLNLAASKVLTKLAAEPDPEARPWLVSMRGQVGRVDGANQLSKAQLLAQERGGCAAEAASASKLGNTYWRFVSVGRNQVSVASGLREPFLRFVPESNRFLGQGMCNRLGGSFAAVGDAITLRQIDKLPNPCPPGTLADSEVFQALATTQRYRFVGSNLELLDAKGKLLVRLSSEPAAGKAK